MPWSDFGLLRQDDQTAIARELGVKGGSLLASWLETINYLRNVAAHHARLWNRTTTLKIRIPKPGQVDAELRHLTTIIPIENKVYSALAVTAYLLCRIDSTNNWPQALRDHVGDFPVHTGMDLWNQMGFPQDWDKLSLWCAN